MRSVPKVMTIQVTEKPYMNFKKVFGTELNASLNSVFVQTCWRIFVTKLFNLQQDYDPITPHNSKFSKWKDYFRYLINLCTRVLVTCMVKPWLTGSCGTTPPARIISLREDPNPRCSFACIATQKNLYSGHHTLENIAAFTKDLDQQAIVAQSILSLGLL